MHTDTIRDDADACAPSTLHRLLLGSCVFAVAFAAAPALAQVIETDDEVLLADDTDEIEDVIIVSGIRQSIEQSLTLKRNNDSIIEAITAEDIGKLPDVSIADSLARLPGVTAQRVRGRAQQISIRGLGPDFSLALLNGREVVSAGSNRGIEFDQFPSELINQGVVYKTPDARLAATGIAGAVDLRTVKPLDFTDSQLNLSARYIINDNGSLNPDFGDDGYRLFGSYIGQNDAGTVGFSLGVTTQNNPTQYFSRELKTSPGQTFETPDGIRFAADNPRSGVVSRDFKRTSVAGALQFEPTDMLDITVDGFYSDFEDAGVFRGVETPLARWAGVADGRGDPAPFPFVEGTPGGFADSAVYYAGADTDIGIAQVLRTDTEGAETELFAIGANMSLDFSEDFGITLDASHSELERGDIDYESYAGTGSRIFGGFDFGGNGPYFAPRDASLVDPTAIITPENGAYSLNSARDFTDPNGIVLADPGGWGQVGFIQEPEVDDELTQLRFEAEHSLGGRLPLVDSLVAGYLYTERTKTFASNRTFLRPGNSFDDLNGAPIPSVIGATDSGTIGLDIVAYDPSALLENGTYVLEPTAGNFFGIDESIDTFYGMLTLGGDNERLNGNIGLQYVETDQSSIGSINTLTGIANFQELGTTFDHWLPTANLSYEIMEDVVLRAAAGQSITRPRLDDLSANQGVSFNNIVCPDTNTDQVPDQFDSSAFNPPQQVCLSFGGGNPFLQPYESTNFDLSAEWYFTPAGAISVAVFHKDLDEYVQGSTSIFTDRQAAINAGLSPGFVDANPNAATFSLGGPANVGEGSLSGIEASLRLPFGDFTDNRLLGGFGFNGSVSYTDAEVEFGDLVVDIPGYSDTTASGELYYEMDGFRARVNTSYRSGYRAELIEFNGNLIGDEALSRTTVDAQIGYEFQEGALEGTSVNIEAYNLTDEPFRTEDNGFIDRREDYGTTYQFTVSKRF